MHLYRADLRRGIPADPPLFQAFQRFRRRMPVPVVFAAGNQDQLRLCQIQQCFYRRIGRAVVPGVEDGAAEGILCSGLGLLHGGSRLLHQPVFAALFQISGQQHLKIAL